MTNVSVLRGSLVGPTVRSGLLVPVAPTTFPIGTPLDGNYKPATATPVGYQNPCIGLAAAAGTIGQPCAVSTSGILQLTVAQLAAVLDTTIYGLSGEPSTLTDALNSFGSTLYLSQGNPFVSLPPPPVSGVLAFQDFTTTNPILQSQVIQIGTVIALDSQPYTSGDQLLGIAIDIQNQTPQKSLALYQGVIFNGATLFGQALFMNSLGNAQLAVASSFGTANVLGLALQASSSGFGSSGFGLVVTQGAVSGTVAQWNAVTGQSSGLTSGAQYYLSISTPGMLTTVAPGSDFLEPVGIALSPTVMYVRPGFPVAAD